MLWPWFTTLRETTPSHARDRHDMIGQVKYYDEPTDWGLILGTDGALYGVHRARLPGPPLQVGERVRFEPQEAPGGPRAADVRRLSSAGTQRSPRV